MQTSSLPAGRQGRRRKTVSALLIIVTALSALGASAGAALGSAPQDQGVAKWQQAMQTLRVPAAGCFSAKFPVVRWTKAKCANPPAKQPFPPAKGPLPAVVGNGADYSAEVAGSISSATGSFDSVSPGITETGTNYVTGLTAPNIYSLQLNVKPFHSPMCSGSTTPGSCLGWEQFLYTASSNEVLIQYWLIAYNAACPSGWNTYLNDCWQNSPFGTPSFGSAPDVATLQSANVTLTGSAIGTSLDDVVMTNGAGFAIATAASNVLHLAGAWKGVEFAIVGDCCGAQATFNAGATISVHTTVHDGTTHAPTCVFEGFTGETNNLSLSGPPALGGHPAPTLVDTQTNALPAPGDCATATSWGDTHLISVLGLKHDFQASGDFEVATTGPRFVVQARQIPYYTHNPNVTLNEGAAAKVGRFSVAVCLAPTRLMINGRKVALAPGGHRNLPGSGSVSRDSAGNTYQINDRQGDYLQAVVLPAIGTDYMNLYVGFGRWPIAVHGLVANAGNNPNAVVSKPGTVLTSPFAFSPYYHVYGDSWRVSRRASLLLPCSGKTPSGDPKTTVDVNNLNKKAAEVARQVCEKFGTQNPALLNACIIDLAILRDQNAVQIYRILRANVRNGIILPPK